MNYCEWMFLKGEFFWLEVNESENTTSGEILSGSALGSGLLNDIISGLSPSLIRFFSDILLCCK